ncbi:hypothetical protein ACHAPE_000716 [Trichoderma viride]
MELSDIFQNVILGIYMIVFGLAIALLEFQVPPQVSRYANFLFSFIGRGVCMLQDPALISLILPGRLLTNMIVYILIGGLLLGDKAIANVAGGIVGIAGIGYVGLEFVPLIEPPSSMREADSGWGAEQV